MGHIPVPWFIGGPANHSAEVARLLAYNATGGRQGIIGNSDCRVLSLQTPGAAVRVMPGAYNIKVQSQKYGMYLGMIDSEDVVNTTPTGSAPGRSDLVVLRVENPTIAGEPWDEPTDPENGPYVRTVIIEGVPSGTTTFGQLGLLDSAIAVARIDFPPSTATVTQSMIKDLRDYEDNPGTPPAAASQMYSRFVPGPATDSNAYLLPHNQYQYMTWPPQLNLTVPIPSFATSCDVTVDVVSAGLNRASGSWTAGTVSPFGGLRINLGTLTTPDIIFDQNIVYGTQFGGGASINVAAGGTLSIPSSMAGKNANLKLEGRSYSHPETNAGLYFHRGSFAKVFIMFKSIPTL